MSSCGRLWESPVTASSQHCLQQALLPLTPHTSTIFSARSEAVDHALQAPEMVCTVLTGQADAMVSVVGMPAELFTAVLA